VSYVALRVVLLVVLVGFGTAVGSVGLLGWRGRLTRMSRAGVRTPGALRSDRAFTLANRVAGPPSIVAGLVSIVCGVAALFPPSLLAVIVIAVIGLIGSVLISRAGGVLGDRAARTVPAPEPPPAAAGCAGCACGAGGCGAPAQA
jgi:uncharacterized membrane protein